MKAKDLVPASSLAANMGVKAVIYGGPGMGKTPLLATAPNPVCMITEPGTLSLRGMDKLPCWEAFDVKRIEEFFDWLFKDNEAKKFDTICIDSVSQMAEIYLKDAKKSNKHGLKAYGDMAENVMKWLEPLYFMQGSQNVVLLSKQMIVESNGTAAKKPYFPGKELNVSVPHLFDLIMHLDIANVPGVGQTKALRCQNSFDVVARDRSGSLNEFEPPDLTAIFNKILK